MVCNVGAKIRIIFLLTKDYMKIPWFVDLFFRSLWIYFSVDRGNELFPHMMPGCIDSSLHLDDVLNVGRFVAQRLEVGEVSFWFLCLLRSQFDGPHAVAVGKAV